MRLPMEFDIVDIRLHCEVEVRRGSSTLSNCVVGSRVRGGANSNLVIGIRFNVHGRDGLALVLQPVKVSAAGLLIAAFETEMITDVPSQLLVTDADGFQCFTASLLLSHIELVLGRQLRQ